MTQQETKIHRRLRHPSPYLLLTLASLFWAGNWVVGRAMRNDIPPVAMGFWRWVVALLILLPFAAPELKRNWRVVRANWFTLALLGGLGAMLFNTMIYVGLQYTAATNGVLFNSVTPILIILMSWLAFRERLGPWQTMGVVLSLAGVAVIVARGEPQILAALKFNRGDLWLISAMFLWAYFFRAALAVLNHNPSFFSEGFAFVHIVGQMVVKKVTRGLNNFIDKFLHLRDFLSLWIRFFLLNCFDQFCVCPFRPHFDSYLCRGVEFVEKLMDRLFGEVKRCTGSRDFNQRYLFFG